MYSIFLTPIYRKKFHNLVCVIIDFDNYLLKKGIWLPRACFFLKYLDLRDVTKSLKTIIVVNKIFFGQIID